MPGVFQWSKTAGSNAGADPSVNWAEGQAPSSINDSARAMMASAANWRDDISGMLVTTGSSAAYAITSNQGFDTLANFHNKTIFFTPHVTNAAGPVTISVDGFANLPLRSSPGKELLAGVLIQGTPYGAIYNNTDGALYLQGFFGVPQSLIPLGGGIDYWGATAPNASFALAQGQAISRITYAALFSLFGITYGTGDGSTTFNIPDKVGRVSAMLDDGSSRLSATYLGQSPATLGAHGGNQSKTLVTANLPPYTPAGTIANVVSGGIYGGLATGAVSSGASGAPVGGPSLVAVASTFAGTAQGGTSAPVATVQPTIICNYIIRII